MPPELVGIPLYPFAAVIAPNPVEAGIPE